MGNTQRLALAASLLALTLSVAGVVGVWRTNRAIDRLERTIAAQPSPGAAAAQAAASTGTGPARIQRGAAPARSYLARDKKTGDYRNVMVPDDKARYSAFVTAAALTPEQKQALDTRYVERRKKEAALAEQMVRDGDWATGRFYDLTSEFWAAEVALLPVEQQAKLPGVFIAPRPRK